MIQVVISCDRGGCTSTANANVKVTNDIFRVLDKNGFSFVTRPDSKQELLLCKKCQHDLSGVDEHLAQHRKAAFSEFFESSKNQ